MNQAKEMARLACVALEDKKGIDIKVLDISELSVMADYFIIANGTNDSQVRAMVDAVEEELHKAGFSMKTKEGSDGKSWVLMDFGDIIVHVFDEENREFYDLERIWRGAKEVTFA